MTENRLNLGCGSETYGNYFVDIYPTRPDVLKYDVDSQKLPFPDNYFDEVYSRNLFEHLSNPLFALKEMKRVLKKRGKLWLLTDNAGWIFFHLPIRKNNYLQHTSNSPREGELDRHYFLFTPIHLKNWLEKIGGFEGVSVKYAYMSRNPNFRFVKPFVDLLGRTFLKNLVNPHLILVAYKRD